MIRINKNIIYHDRKRRHSRRPFLDYSEDQFKSLTEARLFYVKNQPTKHKTVENSYSFEEISPSNKCDNVYVKIGDFGTREVRQ